MTRIKNLMCLIMEILKRVWQERAMSICEINRALPELSIKVCVKAEFSKIKKRMTGK